MNRTVIAIAALAATFGLSAADANASPSSPNVTADATCSGLTVTTSGWPEGSEGIVGFGSNPPWGATLNTTVTYQGYISATPIDWNVLLRGPGQVQQELQGVIDCSPRVDTTEPIEAPPAAPAPAQVDVDPLGVWDHIALAPPW